MLHYIYIYLSYLSYFSFLVKNNILFDILIAIEQSKLLFWYLKLYLKLKYYV